MIIRSPNLWLTFGLSAHTTKNQTNCEIGNERKKMCFSSSHTHTHAHIIKLPTTDLQNSNVIHTWRTDSFRVLIGKIVCSQVQQLVVGHL